MVWPPPFSLRFQRRRVMGRKQVSLAACEARRMRGLLRTPGRSSSDSLSLVVQFPKCFLIVAPLGSMTAFTLVAKGALQLVMDPQVQNPKFTSSYWPMPPLPSFRKQLRASSVVGFQPSPSPLACFMRYPCPLPLMFSQKHITLSGANC